MDQEVHNHRALTLQLCGGFEAHRESAAISNLHLRDGTRVLAYLALHNRRWVEKKTLVNLFWDREEVANPDHSLRQSIQLLRKNLGDDAILLETRNGEIRIVLNLDQADTLRLETASKNGSIKELQAALAETDMPLLSGWDDPWITQFRQRFEKRRDMAKERLLHMQAEWSNECERGELPIARELSSPVFSRVATVCAGGALPLNHPHYIERTADVRLYSALDRNESAILIKGPRQTGKSSLLARGSDYARNHGWTVLQTDFEQMHDSDFANGDTFYQRLIASLAEQMDQDYSVARDWKPLLGSSGNLESYLRKRVLQASAERVLWAMDAVDTLFHTSLYQEFFTLLRSFHTKNATQPHLGWDRLTNVIATATEAHLYISDLNQSPFNVGIHLLVDDFTLLERKALRERIAPGLLSDESYVEINSLLGGHPYLITRALAEIQSRNLTPSEFVSCAMQSYGPYHDHLERMAKFIEADAELKEGVLSILTKAGCSERSFFRLRSAGAIVGDSPEKCALRCELYSQFLRKRLK